MGIRCSSKALIHRDGKILLNRCADEVYGDYYSLPGGGQHTGETMHETLVRECLEETGYTVKPVRFAALCEAISPNTVHKMYHIFVCEITDTERKTPTETDELQVSTDWVALEDLPNIRMTPHVLRDRVRDIVNGAGGLFLGSEYIL